MNESQRGPRSKERNKDPASSGCNSAAVQEFPHLGGSDSKATVSNSACDDLRFEERDESGNRKVSGGQHSTCGTPQGGVISPLLANLYMNRFLKFWRITGRGEAFRAAVVTYADDFVILSRGYAAEALSWTRSVMGRIHLTLNEAKTSIKRARTESFDFLGYTFGPHCFKKDGWWYVGESPSKKSLAQLRLKVADCLRRHSLAPWPAVRDHLNMMVSDMHSVLSPGP